MDKPFEPYYAVIFTSVRIAPDKAYDAMNNLTFAEVEKMSGYLGADSFRNDDGKGVTIARFRTAKDVAAWRANPIHREAQQLGRDKWYSHYNIKICRVEREYEFNK